MKKLLFAVLVSAMSSLALGQAELAVSSVEAAPNTQVVVPMVVSGMQNVAALQFDVNFDSTVLSLVENSAVLAGDLFTDHSLGWRLEGDRLTVIVFSTSLSPLSGSQGLLCQVVFEVREEAAEGTESAVEISSVTALDSEGTVVETTTQNGVVRIGGGVTEPSEAQNRMIFPHVGNGTFSDGRFVVTLAFVNRSDATATARIRFIESDGSPFVLTLADGRSDSEFVFTLAPGGSTFLRSDGSGALTTGYAVLDSTAPLGGALIFSTDDTTGQTITQAGVGASSPRNHMSMPVEFERGVVDTGIAVANPGSNAAEVTLILKGQDGEEIERKSFDLAEGTHDAQFSSEFFPALRNEASFKGSIEIQASTPVSVIAVQQKGLLLTTFPVAAL